MKRVLSLHWVQIWPQQHGIVPPQPRPPTMGACRKFSRGRGKCHPGRVDVFQKVTSIAIFNIFYSLCVRSLLKDELIRHLAYGRQQLLSQNTLCWWTSFPRPRRILDRCSSISHTDWRHQRMGAVYAVLVRRKRFAPKFLLRDARTASAVGTPIAIVNRPSVRPSVTLWYPERICWVNSKVIIRIISLRSSLLEATTSAI